MTVPLGRKRKSPAGAGLGPCGSAWMTRLTASLFVMGNAKNYGGVQPDPHTYINVTVENRGTAPTTVRHLALVYYSNRLATLLPEWISRWIKVLQAGLRDSLARTVSAASSLYVAIAGWQEAVKLDPHSTWLLRQGAHVLKEHQPS